jgi:3-dehydroquinate dehydratase/shikimate dehydrogenase
MSRICLTLAEQDPSLLEEKLRRSQGTVGFIEVRIDALEDPERCPSPPLSTTRFIATCRPIREGGSFGGDEKKRLEILERASKSGFHWIDLEHDVKTGMDRMGTARILRSAHNFEGFPANLALAFDRIAGLPGDGAKIAVTVTGTADLVELLTFLEAMAPGPTHVILGMGSAGIVTRVLGPLLGGAWTYVVESADRSVAPGQFSLSDARDVFRIDHWREVPQLFGLVSSVAGPYSRVRELNHRFGNAGIDAIAVPLVLDSVEDWFDYVSSSRLPWRGFGFDSPVEVRSAARLGLAGGGPADTFTCDQGVWRAAKADSDRQFQIWAGTDSGLGVE